MPLLSQFLVSNLANNSFAIFRSSTKNPQHFWTFLLSSSSSNPFELNSNEFEFTSFNRGLFYFLIHICMSLYVGVLLSF